jgi:hypothetical protein
MLTGAPASATPSNLPDLGVVTNGPVYATASSGSTLYLGGSFTQIGPQTGPGVAVDAASGAAQSLPQVSGAAATVSSVISDGSGGWYVGGSFTHVGSVARSGLAHINSDGSVDTTLPQVSGSNGSPYPTVKTLLLDAGTLYVGGDFTAIGGQARTDLAAVSTGSGAVAGWNPAPNSAFTFTLTVNALALSGSTLYVGGVFSSIGGQSRGNLAALDATPSGSGGATGWNPSVSFANGLSSPVVSALALSGSTLYVGGSFDTIGTNVLTRHNLAALDTASGSAAATWNPNVGDGSAPAAGTVTALALSGAALYVGGDFQTVGGTFHPGLAAVASAPAGPGSAFAQWDPAGAQSDLGAQAPSSPAVSTLAASGSTLYVGGNFTSIGGSVRSDVAALNADADLSGPGAATSWNPDANNPVLAVAAAGPSVYVGGALTSVGGVARRNLAAVDESTGQVTAFDPDAETTAGGVYAGAAPAVRALALSAGTLYAGGQFDQIGANHLTRTALAAVDVASGDATPLDAAVGGPAQSAPVVDSLLSAASGSQLYVGGSFTTIGANNQTRSALAEIDPTTGNASSTWDPAASAPGGGGSSRPATVSALALSGSTLYAGGYFTSLGGQARDGLAALNANPSAAATATAWNPAPPVAGSGSAPTVFALAASANTVYVGGSFTEMGGQQRSSLAAVDAGTGSATSWAPNPLGSVYALSVSGSGEIVYVGGSFTAIGTRHPLRINVAAVDAYTGDPTNWDPIPSGSLGPAGLSPASVVDSITATGTGVTVGDGFASFDLAPASGLASFSDSSPANTAAPGTSDPAGPGAPTQGDVLSETAATWTGSPTSPTYQWLRCDANGVNCAAILSQTGAAHAVSGADVGSTLRVQETVVSGTTTSDPATSPPTAVVAAAASAPANSGPPTISGVLAAGQTLTAGPGIWSGSNNTYGYQWLRCDPSGANCQPVASRTASTYTLSAADGGDTLRVAVAATDVASADASAPVSSAATGVVPLVPVATSAPTLSGTAQQGQTLTEAHGTWAGAPTSYRYQWLRCSSLNGCTVVSGASAQTYALTAADLGYTIEVSETAANASGSGSPSVSVPTAAVLGPPGSPTSSAPPTISGTAVAGQTLTETHGTWRGLPTGYSYQWLRCATGTCVTIAGATAQTYTLGSADIGATLIVAEQATNGSGTGAPATSAPTGAVASAPTAAPAYTVAPSIAGNPQQGQTLTEAHGTWINNPTSFAYSWQRCDSSANCLPITGATSASYTLTAADVGSTIVVDELASNSLGSGTAPSNPTAVVTPPPTGNTAPPTISGAAQQGQTLIEVHGAWSATPTGYSYQWQLCNATGGGCSDIAGATAQTYVAASADVGHTLRVLESITTTGGSAGPGISAATAVVSPPAPSSSAPPSILGTPQQGKTLTELGASWSGSPTSFRYQWQQCDALGSGCADIVGATGASYVPVGGDVGDELRVEEWATNAGGTGGPATSGASAAVLTAAPASTSAPAISGSAQQGQTLTESPGTWSGSPSSLTYQWQRCDATGTSCTDVSGATAATYVLGAGDVGARMRVEEIAANAGGPTAAPSTATATVIPLPPANTAAPTVGGAARQGQTLTETHGAWSNNPAGYTIQWQRCDVNGANCSTISSGPGQTYVLALADAGHTIVASETASNAGGTGSAAASQATGVVVPLAPIDSTPPGVSGTARQGQTLSEVHGTWANAPSSYTYAWERCDTSGSSCAPISAAGATYQLTPADVGHTLRVQESATNAGGTGGPATSGATATVLPPAPASSAPPTISGTVRDGQTLTESHGTWSDAPTSFTYAWLRCDSGGSSCAAIPGATAASYTPSDADVGHALAVSETAANAGGAGSPATSAATLAVTPPPGPANSALPTISGVAQSGQTLAEAHGAWSNSPSAYAYQWLRCDASGANCSGIDGATGASYAAGGDDVGHAIRVDETASNPGGSATARSAATAPVAQMSAPASTSPPAISGVAQLGQTLTESHGGWTGAPSGFGYQWLRCDANGAGCAAIAGAAGQTYAISAADVGATLRVQETADNAGGSSAPAASDSTGAVAPPPGAPGPGSAPAPAPASGGGPAAPHGGAPSLTQTGSARLALSSGALILDGGLQVGCQAGGSACTVTLVVTSPAPKSRGKAGARKPARALTLGRALLTVAAGRHQELSLRLTSAAANMLAAKHHLGATLKVSVSAGALAPVTASRALSLSNPPKKRAKHA